MNSVVICWFLSYISLLSICLSIFNWLQINIKITRHVLLISLSMTTKSIFFYPIHIFFPITLFLLTLSISFQSPLVRSWTALCWIIGLFSDCWMILMVHCFINNIDVKVTLLDVDTRKAVVDNCNILSLVY